MGIHGVLWEPGRDDDRECVPVEEMDGEVSGRDGISQEFWPVCVLW